MESTTMSRAVMPGMANHRGILFGGQLMAWMDEVSGIAARRFAGTEVTTVAVEQIRFLQPVFVGDFVDVTGEVVSVGNTSLKVQIKVEADRKSGEKTRAAEAAFIYVTVDDEGKSVKVGKTL